MNQLKAQCVVSATLKHGDPAVMLAPGTRATLVWLRSFRRGHSEALTHEYEAYAHNDLGHFVRIQVNSDQIEGVEMPHSE